MARNKASKDQDHEATLTRLRADLKRSEAKRAAWKKRAKQAERALAKGAAPDAPAPTAATSGTDPRSPDASWTVAQLRAEARRRGISGLSNKPKAELVKALG
jgi:hypothetical protein